MGQVDGFDIGGGRPRLRRGLRVTHLGDERLVLDPSSGRVHRVRGSAARVLDAILTGRSGRDDELIAELAEVGIIDLPTVSRRNFVLASGLTSGLVISTFLPTATAAASSVEYSVAGSGGDLKLFTVTDGAITYDLYRLAHTVLTGTAISRTFTIGTSAKAVEIVLVGAGGSGGGAPSDDGFGAYPVAFSGGGGGGEVVEVDLGTVPTSTSFVVTVAGATSTSARNGASSFVTIGATDIVTAKGGGSGATSDDVASSGGSGGGGSTDNASGGSTVSGGVTSSGGVTPVLTSTDARAGGVGVGTAGGGGGGASTTGADGSGTQGGAGGAGIDISDFLKTYTSVAGDDPGDYPSLLGGGGGGCGSADGAGGTGGTGGGGAGGHAVENNPAADTAQSGERGTIGTGGGGGGGGAVNGAAAQNGSGASGVAWIRIRR